MNFLIKLRRKLIHRKNNVFVGRNLRTGNNVLLWAPNSLTIGNDVYIGHNSSIQIDGQIGDCVLIANNVGIVGRTDHDIKAVGTSVRFSDWVGKKADLSKNTNIGSDVWIGFGAVILSGVSIGDSTIIGAGTVVTDSIPKNSIAVGNPAKVISCRFSAEDFHVHWSLLESKGVKRHDF